MKRVWKTVPVLWVVLAFLHPAVAGEVYTRTDADGTNHNTDRRPEAPTPVERVIRFANPTDKEVLPDPVAPPESLDMQQAEQLNKRLKRLKERKAQLEKTIVQNQASIRAAEKEAAYYQKRSGSYARRNEKSILRQLVVLKNNLTTYQTDHRYIEEDMAETERLLSGIGEPMKRPAPAAAIP